MKKGLVLALLIVLSACKGPEGSGGETVVTWQSDRPVREYEQPDRSDEEVYKEKWYDAFGDQEAAVQVAGFRRCQGDGERIQPLESVVEGGKGQAGDDLGHHDTARDS